MQNRQHGTLSRCLLSTSHGERRTLARERHSERKPHLCVVLRYIDVILPLAIPGTYTYAWGEDLPEVTVGMRVSVPFGRGRKLYGALVRRVHSEAPPHHKPRPALGALDTAPVVTEEQFLLWERISEHYLCHLGEVMIAALPAQLSLSSETRLVLTGEPHADLATYGRAGIVVEALLHRSVITLEEAGDLLGLKDPMPTVKRLMEQGTLRLEERMSAAWKARTAHYVELQPEARSEAALHGWFDALERAPKQLHLLMRYVELSRCLSEQPREVERPALLRAAGVNSTVLSSLVEKGLFRIDQREAGTPPPEDRRRSIPALSPAQQQALNEVRQAFLSKPVTLLRGVTASGKTELYITLIQEALDRGEQVLYLLPEIALTTQIIARLRERFGDRVTVAHSRMSHNERARAWMDMTQGPHPPPIIVGARSAILLPYRKLGLVVVDEEHDPSYKQQDPAPRYNARDMAIVLASLHGARTLLGSATPSMETLHNARSGKFGLAELLTRFGDVALPGIQRIDLRDAYKRKTMRGHFSLTLIEHIQRALERREQVILFQNRRGYVPVWQCETCSWVPECDQCDVSLTYHKSDHQLRCHYCGRHYPPPLHCGSCGSNRLRMLGFGTEKIEEELALQFPEARIGRMDQDTMRGKHAMDRLLTSFGEGGIDILVGTQMVTKGLDFDHVSLVGIINADKLLRFPDIRAHERAFQLMAQVAGRAGRRKEAGMVLIQATEVDHPVLQFVVEHDVEGMYARELEHRRAHGYPPFTRLIELTLKHRSEERVTATAAVLAVALRDGLGERVLGPDVPVVSRIRDRHLRKLMIKVRRSAHAEEKAFISDTIDRVFSDPLHAAVQLVTDVDPL
jgi:primosomal protein N' (replication factor Y)